MSVVLIGTQTGSSTSPSVVSILADDLGYYDRASAGNKNVTTPSLDGLWASGVHLTRFYGYKYCSPTRRSFVSGRWPIHLNEMNQVADGIDLRMSTLGDKLRTANYTNYLIGKTHWGVKSDLHLPINRGWDFHLGYLGGAEAYASGRECVNETVNCDNYTDVLDLWHNSHPAEKEYIGEYSTLLYTKLAVEIVHNHSREKSNPMWLHLNYQAVHNPQTSPPHEPHCDDDPSRVFYQVLQSMDEGIGQVVDALQEAGMWQNTLVIFMSDNGAAQHGNNFPLRGGKYSPYEGGVRLAAVVSGGFLPPSVAGTSYDGIIHVSDFYPTMCYLAGVDSTDNPPSQEPAQWFWPVDGKNFWNALVHNSTSPWQNVPLVISSPYTSGPGGGAMILDEWKVVYNSRNDGWDQPPDKQKSSPTIGGNSTCKDGSKARKCLVCTISSPCLYNVASDPSEVSDVSMQFPDILLQLNSTYAKLVFDARTPVELNFTEDNGFNCSSSTSSNVHSDGGGDHSEKALQGGSIQDACSVKPSNTCYRTSNHAVGSIKSCNDSKACCMACSNTEQCNIYSLDIDKSICWLLRSGASSSDRDNCSSGATSPIPPPECSGFWGCYAGPQCICTHPPCFQNMPLGSVELNVSEPAAIKKIQIDIPSL